MILEFFITANLFNITGAKWRNLRVKVTPTFTSGKMKMMFPTMVECGKELQEYINNVADGIREVDIKDVLARFTTDIISSCAFGIQSNSLKNPDSEFRKYGRKIFEPNIMAVIRGFLFNLSPNLAQYLRVSQLFEMKSLFVEVCYFSEFDLLFFFLYLNTR